MRHHRFRGLYEGRKLTEGYPGLAELERQQVIHRPHHTEAECRQTVEYIFRLLPGGSVPRKRRAMVVGCGASPHIIRILCAAGFEAIGVEPVAKLAAEARTILEGEAKIVHGTGECLPAVDATQSVVLLESVLEHVDSPEKTLAEVYRVLMPGGLAYITTTNRLSVRNDEYTKLFFQWYPQLLNEAFVYHHLHFDPSLGNYTTRPAVHWFTYAELCRLGRSAGFGEFYSKLDVITKHDPPMAKSVLRRLVFERVRTSPFLRALALTQRAGGAIFMLKRAES